MRGYSSYSFLESLLPPDVVAELQREHGFDVSQEGEIITVRW
jgi:hypothetical protein